MAKESLAVAVVQIALGVALVGGLFGAGWNVYRRLPGDAAAAMTLTAIDSRAKTELTVMLQSAITGVTLNSPVEIIPSIWSPRSVSSRRLRIWRDSSTISFCDECMESRR